MNNIQGTLNPNSKFFIHDNAFENVVCQNNGYFAQGRLFFVSVLILKKDTWIPQYLFNKIALALGIIEQIQPILTANMQLI